MESNPTYRAQPDAVLGWHVVNTENHKVFPIRFGNDEVAARDMAVALSEASIKRKGGS